MGDSRDKSLVSAQQTHYSSALLRIALRHFLLGKFASASLSIATLLILLRSLSIEDYGTYVTLIAIQGVAILLSSLGLDSAIDRYMPELRLTHGERQLRTAVMVALLLRLLVLAAVLGVSWGLSHWLAPFFGDGDWGELLPLLMMIILLGGLFNFSTNILDTLLLQKSSQLSGLAYTFIRLAVVLAAMSYTALDVEKVLYAEVISTAFALFMALAALSGYFLKTPAQTETTALFDRAMRWRILRFSGLNYGARLLGQTQGPHGLRLIVSYLLGVGAAAKFGFVMSLADILERYLPTTLLARLIRPIFVTRYTTRRDFLQINAFASLLVKINLVILAPVLMLAVVYGADVVLIIGGQRYAGTEWLLVLALVLLIPNSQKVVIGLVANTLEKNVVQFAGGMFSVMGLALGILLGLEFGLYGVVAAAIFAAIAYNAYSIYYLKEQGYRYSSDVRGAAKIVLASVLGICGAGLFTLMNNSLPTLLLSSLLGIVLYALLLRMLDPFGARDRELLDQVIPKRLGWALKLLGSWE